MSLSELKLGKSGIISHIEGNEALAKRLLALGCIEGTPVCIKSVAPLGDPLVIGLRGTKLAIRKKDAKGIVLQEV